MALSQHEQRALEQLAAALTSEDPDFASTLATGVRPTPSRRQRALSTAAFAIGLVMLTFAIFVPARIEGGILAVSVLGYLVMFAAALSWFERAPLRRFLFDAARDATCVGDGPSAR